jgi:sec-independent protein translocase protein TatC
MATESLAGEMSLWDHLTELRGRLVKCAIALALGSIVAWILYPHIFDFLIGPLEQSAPNDAIAGGSGKLLTLDPTEAFGVRIKISTYTGFAIAMPVMLWQLWRFIAPGLYSNEKKWAAWFVAAGSALFFLGAGIAFWTLPKALDFLQEVGGDYFIEAYSPAKYLRLITYMMLAFGLGFEFPILLAFLQMAGVVKTDQLRQFRRYAIVGIAVVVAVVTPSADPISMLALTIPMCLFYEAAIIFGRMWERSKRKSMASS